MTGAWVRASEEAGQVASQLRLVQGPRAAAIWGCDTAGDRIGLVPMLLSDGVGDAEPAMLGCAFSSLSVMVEVEVERPKLPRGLRCVSFNSGRRRVRG